jgi:hypothetical protein
MGNIEIILDEAILLLLKTCPREDFCRDKLIELLKKQYVEKYESSDSIAEINDYELALKSIIFKKHSNSTKINWQRF